MRYIDVTYNGDARTLTLSSSLAGTTVDDLSTSFRLDETTLALDADIDMVYGVILRGPNRTLAGYSFSRFDEDGEALIPSDVLKACRGGSLPVYLRIIYTDDGSIETSLPMTLSVANLPDPVEAVHASGDLIMTRMGSWEWKAGLTYAKGAVVTRSDKLWISKEDGNLGNEPSASSVKWAVLTQMDASTITYLSGLTGNVQNSIDCINGALDDIADDLADEATTRRDNDNALGGRIDTLETGLSTETRARQDKDTQLERKINQEISDRRATDADTLVQAKAEAQTVCAQFKTNYLDPGLESVDTTLSEYTEDVLTPALNEARSTYEQATASITDKADRTQLSDGSVTKIGTSTVGAANKPIFLQDGVPKVCDTVAATDVINHFTKDQYFDSWGMYGPNQIKFKGNAPNGWKSIGSVNENNEYKTAMQFNNNEIQLLGDKVYRGSIVPANADSRSIVTKAFVQDSTSSKPNNLIHNIGDEEMWGIKTMEVKPVIKRIYARNNDYSTKWVRVCTFATYSGSGDFHMITRFLSGTTERTTGSINFSVDICQRIHAGRNNTGLVLMDNACQIRPLAVGIAPVAGTSVGLKMITDADNNGTGEIWGMFGGARIILEVEVFTRINNLTSGSTGVWFDAEATGIDNRTVLDNTITWDMQTLSETEPIGARTNTYIQKGLEVTQ